MTRSATFEYVRSTKNTYLYQEVEGDRENMIGSVYIKKSAIPTKPPVRIILTLEVSEAAS